MTKSEREKELGRLKCPTCKSQLVIHADGLACMQMQCGGIVSPDSIGTKLTLESLKKEFPELRSIAPLDTGNAKWKPSEPAVLRQRAATSKQAKSIPGQMSLIDE